MEDVPLGANTLKIFLYHPLGVAGRGKTPPKIVGFSHSVLTEPQWKI